MPENMEPRPSDLLNHPDVLKATDNINRKVTDRRNFPIQQCPVFSHPFTVLEKDPQYRFTLDKEACRQLPDIIENPVQKILGKDTVTQATQNSFGKKRNIGIVFSGGPAPGGHNVIAGLYDAAKKANPENRIFGFLMGPDGIIENEVTPLTDAFVDAHRNMGGFCMIKTGRTKIDSAEKIALSRATCLSLELDAVVVVGGDDSNTNAAFLAQELKNDGIQVIGVPKTIDGDIQVRDNTGKILCAMSFGFHTAALAFSESVSNLCTDCSSDVKYWHICKVMGRVASHLALETALQTHANLTLIGEDLANYVDHEKIDDSKDVDYSAYGMTLRHLSRVICDSIVRRAAVGKNYGVIVIPEGVLEFINEILVFIIKLNTIIAQYNDTHDSDFHTTYPLLDDKIEYLRRLVRGIRKDVSFGIWNARDDELFNDIPAFFQEGLLMERDSHGNFQFSQVETDKVLMGLVEDYLGLLKEKGEYRIGIRRSYFKKNMDQAGLDPDTVGPVLFENYNKGADFLLTALNIISVKTLTQAFVDAGVIDKDKPIPAAIQKIYQKSVPSLKTQTHFYGYDGRGSDPTTFDATYTYNLGLTVFSLIANGATGQMAAIRNLEKGFSHWSPIGIPIAPLMHLEERKGRLALVLEKSIVDVDSTAFNVVKAHREKWLSATPGEDNYRRSDAIQLTEITDSEMPLTLKLNALDYLER